MQASRRHDGPAGHTRPVYSKVLLVGQAPGDEEPKLARPFAWTEVCRSSKWFAPLGLTEVSARDSTSLDACSRARSVLKRALAIAWRRIADEFFRYDEACLACTRA